MILVTGHKGFIGGHLTKALDDRGLAWRGFDLKEGDDIRDYETCKKKVKGVDSVIHLAALAGVGGGEKDPRSYITTNSLGTLNLLEALDEKTHFIFFSSASVYGNQSPPNSEITPTNPTSLYGLTKLEGEMLVRMKARYYTIIRPFNVYGENGRLDQVLYKWKREGVTIRGNGTSKRGYTYVGDLVKGIMNVLEKHPTNDIYNFGSEKPITLNEVASLFSGKVSREPMPKNEIHESWADSFKAQEVFNFQPTTDFMKKAKELIK